MRAKQPRQAWLFPAPPGTHPEVSVIMPMGRPGPEADRAVEAVLAQVTERPFELIVISGTDVDLPRDSRIRHVVIPDRNPAVRRNRGAKVAKGLVLAFIDDDAFAEPSWLEAASLLLDEDEQVLAVGGPDPGPEDASIREKISDTLLATPLVGSGIAAHESRRGTFRIRAPFDVALVNLFVRADAFRDTGGFDETIGYIGEDTDLIGKLMELGPVLYSETIIVRHRRRFFPGPYLKQRWRYRVKTGEMLVRGSRAYRTSGKIVFFLAGGFGFLALALISPPIAAILLLIYALAVSALAIPRTSLPMRWWWVIPPTFLLHHATYFTGIIAGMARALFRR
jgi:GT2 family glycosyltransferase